MKEFVKRNEIILVCMLYFSCIMTFSAWAAQTAVTSANSRNQAWTIETGNNSDLQTNIDGKADALTADQNYVTDAQLVVVGNTSNTNTGDQVISDATITTTDITTNDATSAKHGFLPKLSNTVTEFLNGQGGFSVPAGSGSGDVTAAAVITATAIVVGDDGAKGVKETGVLIDASDNITGVTDLSADSVSIVKTSGVAGLVSVAESTTTSDLYFGWMGAADLTDAESYSAQVPDTQPEGSFAVFGTPAGTGDPNGNKVSAMTWVLFPVEIGAAASDETTDLTTGTGKVTFRAPFAFTLTEVRSNVGTAPTGTALSIDINEGGVSVLSTVITIDVSELTSVTAATPPVISDSAIADDAAITVDIDVIGSTIAGKGLKIWLIGTRTL